MQEAVFENNYAPGGGLWPARAGLFTFDLRALYGYAYALFAWRFGA